MRHRPNLVLPPEVLAELARDRHPAAGASLVVAVVFAMTFWYSIALVLF